MVTIMSRIPLDVLRKKVELVNHFISFRLVQKEGLWIPYDVYRQFLYKRASCQVFERTTLPIGQCDQPPGLWHCYVCSFQLREYGSG